MATHTPIFRLPTELIVAISDRIETVKDLGNFRRTCTSIAFDLAHSFGQEFFTRRVFMLEAPSLDALAGIVESPFASYMTQLVMSTQSYDTMYDEFSHSQDISTPRMVIVTGQALRIMTTALSGLPNLKSLSIRHGGTSRLIDVPRNWQQGPWGHSELPDTTSDPRITTPDLVFSLLLAALGASSAAPTALDVYLADEDTLTPKAFAPHDLSHLRSGISAKLANLHTLHLCLRLSSNDSNAPTAMAIVTLKNFTSSVRNVRHLRLTFEHNDLAANRYLNWLCGLDESPCDNDDNDDHEDYNGPPAPKLPITARFPNVINFQLGSATLQASTVRALLQHFPLLASFTLRHIYLEATHHTDGEDDRFHGLRDWRTLLQNIGDDLSTDNTINYIKLVHLWLDGDRQTARFTPRTPSPGARGAADVLYVSRTAIYDKTTTQINAKEWLEEVTGRIT